MELHAFDFGGELFAQRFVFLLFRRREGIATAEHVHALALQLLELTEQVGDSGETLDGVGLERGLHLGERHGVVLVLVVILLGRAFFAVFVVAGIVIVRIVVVADRGAGGLFRDFAIVLVLAFLHLLGRRLLRQHRVEIEDLAQLHLFVVERFGPMDDGVEGDRALA